MVKRAILSVSDKPGIVELARRLADQGVTLLSTGGTMKAIEQAGVFRHRGDGGARFSGGPRRGGETERPADPPRAAPRAGRPHTTEQR